MSINSIDVDLIEEGLGPMRLRALSRGGALHVSLAASDPVVRNQLQGHAADLRREIASSGIDLGSLDVDTLDVEQRQFAGGGANAGLAGDGAGGSSRDGRSTASRTGRSISGRITSGIGAIAPRTSRTLTGAGSDNTSDSTSSSGIDVRI